MKELAVLGGSNIIISYGLGHILKEKLGDECNIYAIGNISSLYGVWELLTEKILGNYKYAILAYNINETAFIINGQYSLECMIANYVYIINSLLKSGILPIYVLYPCMFFNLHESRNYILKGIAEIYNIPVIDVETSVLWIDKNVLSSDNSHLYPYYQEYIANEIIKCLSENHQPKSVGDIPLKFSLFPMSQLDLEKRNLGTSLLKLDCYKLVQDQKIIIPEDQYLYGIIYWLTENTAFLHYKNKFINFIKNLSKDSTHAFIARTIGWSFNNGLKGGELSIVQNSNDFYCEPTGSEENKLSQHDELYISGLILSNISAFQYGKDYYWKHYQIFCHHKEILINSCYEFSVEQQQKFFKSLNIYFKDADKIFKEILYKRPDLSKLLYYDNNRTIRLFLWAFLFGVNEMENLKGKEKLLKQALINLIPANLVDNPSELSLYFMKLL